MMGIIGVIAVLVTLVTSLIVTRIATTALTLTGLSLEVAAFQARSTFTGTGFTTSESEQVVSHPVRRRILSMLMIFRSAGMLTVLMSLILSFGGSADDVHKLTLLAWMTGGVLVLFLLSGSRWVDRGLSRALNWALRRWTDLDLRDYANLLELAGEYGIVELQVEESDWLAGRQLRQCELNSEGITVLGIRRAGGVYVGAPHGPTEIRAGDTLILYGRAEGLRELDNRRAGSAGNRAHTRAQSEYRRHEAEQDLLDRQLGRQDV